MFSTLVLLAALVAAAPVPLDGIPPPREVKPEISILVHELVSRGEAGPLARIVRIGFRNGKALQRETVWEGEEQFLSFFFYNWLVNDRFVVTGRGGIIDTRGKKVLNDENDGSRVEVDGLNVFYQIEGGDRAGVYRFDMMDGTLHQVSDKPKPPWYGNSSSYRRLSSDGTKLVGWGEQTGELILYRDVQKPKSLGKGFDDNVPLAIRVRMSIQLPPAHVMWLDNGLILTQRGTGKLVTVDVEGRVDELLTIKEVQKECGGCLFRDRTERIIYYVAQSHYAIDIAKKSVEKIDWEPLGDGFEASWKMHDKFGYTLRYKGKEIGSFHCWPHNAKTAPGYLAIPGLQGQERGGSARSIAVWSAATGEWTTTDFDWLPPSPLFGWIK